MSQPIRLAMIIALLCMSQSDLKAADALAQREQDMRRAAIEQWRALPDLELQSIRQVFDIHIVKGQLQITSPLNMGPPGQWRMSLGDLPGMCSIQFMGLRQNVQAFNFICDSSSDSSPAEDRLEVQVISGSQTNVTRSVVASDGKTFIVQLQYNADLKASAVGYPDAPVRLYLQFLNDPTKSNLTLNATSFETLRQEHGAEFDQYVRPIFQMFQRGDIVAQVDPKTAWQVLSDDWKPTADLAADVQATIKQLDADDYSARSKAEKLLLDLGEPAGLYLATIDRNSLSPEQKARVEQIVSLYHPLTDPQAKKLRSDSGFLLDCMGSDDVTLRSAALERLSIARGQAIPFNVNAPDEARSTAIEQLRQQLVTQPATQP